MLLILSLTLLKAAYQDATETDGGVTDDEEREARASLPANESFEDTAM